MTHSLVDPVALLTELIAIPSVNPRGRPEPAEAAAARQVAAWGRHLGLEVRTTDVVDGRPNVVLTLPGRDPSAGWVLLESHLDTVELPAGIGPPVAVVDAGRVAGRGACDAKGAVATMVAALARLAPGGPAAPVVGPTIRLAAVVDEEHHYRGVLALLAELESDGLLPSCRGAVVGEPTGLTVVAAHKGVLRCRLVAEGPGGHSSLGHAADNPVVSLARAITVLDQHAAGLVGPSASPLVSGGSLAVTMIGGGLGENSIPPRCEAVLDRRLAPGEDPAVAWRAIRDLLAAHAPTVRVEPAHTVDPSLCTDPGHPFVRALLAVTAAGGGRPDPIGASWGSDASKLAARGIPAVVWGPGSIDQAHTDGEFVGIDQLERGVVMLVEFLRSL